MIIRLMALVNNEFAERGEPLFQAEVHLTPVSLGQRAKEMHSSVHLGVLHQGKAQRLSWPFVKS